MLIERKDMNKKIWIPIVLVGLLLLGGIAYLYRSLDEQKKVNQDMQELAMCVPLMPARSLV